MKNLLFTFLIMLPMSIYAQATVNDKGYIHPYAFYSDDGILFCENGSEKSLVKYPPEKYGDSYTVPDGITIIAKGAFKGNEHIVNIKLPSSVRYIGDGAFNDCNKLQKIEVYNSSSAVRAVEAEDAHSTADEIGRYNIQGVKINKDENGQVQIILYSDGTAKKIIK